MLGALQTTRSPENRGQKRPHTSPEGLEETLGRLVSILERNEGQHRSNGPNKRPRQDKRCDRCGGFCQEGGVCPAQSQTCYNCQKVGHYGKVCRSARVARPPPVTGPNRNFAASLLCAANTDNSLLPISIEGSPLVEALVDSGATKSYIDAAFSSQLGLTPQQCRPGEAISQGAQQGVAQRYAPKTFVVAKWSLGPVKGVFKFYRLDNASTAVILGVDFQRTHRLIPVAHKGAALLGEKQLELPYLPEFGTSRRWIAVQGNTAPTELKLDIGELTAEQQRQLLQLVTPKYFATDERPFGKATSICHPIDTPGARPICQPLRPTSPAERQIVREEVAKMLAQGAIRPSASPWASPIVLVRKKDGSVRFCIDNRKVNDVTVKDRHPLPRISDMLEALHGAKYYTSLDAASGYWQIPMETSAIPKTAFLCSEGLFEWLVMPFGLTNAPATYQRAMNQLLAGLLWQKCLVYLDDVLIYSTSFEKHLQDVKEVMDRLHGASFLLKAKKCSFAKGSNRISAEGVSMDEAKLKKVEDFPTPTTPTEIRAFLGLTGYYRKFIRNYALIAAPMHKLTEKAVEWKWAEPKEQAFRQLKKLMAKDILLPFPNFSQPFIVDTDASRVGMAAILSQAVNGQERPVLMESRKFRANELKWHIREKEACAIVYAVRSSVASYWDPSSWSERITAVCNGSWTPSRVG